MRYQHSVFGIPQGVYGAYILQKLVVQPPICSLARLSFQASRCGAVPAPAHWPGDDHPSTEELQQGERPQGERDGKPAAWASEETLQLVAR